MPATCNRKNNSDCLRKTRVASTGVGNLRKKNSVSHALSIKTGPPSPPRKMDKMAEACDVGSRDGAAGLRCKGALALEALLRSGGGSPPQPERPFQSVPAPRRSLPRALTPSTRRPGRPAAAPGHLVTRATQIRTPSRANATEPRSREELTQPSRSPRRARAASRPAL